ncbi:MAG: type II secretion system F family protein [Coxiellaceae bacterium]|nr:type II secretion system F family protein [Coxiellaceae bacterium]
MPNFSYSGRDAHGNKVSGIIEAAGSDAVAAQLFAKHITPISISQKAVAAPATSAGGKKSTTSFSLPAFFSRKVKLEELAIFSQNMSVLLDAGVAIVTAVKQLGSTATSKILKSALLAIAGQLEEGQSLAKVIRQYPKVFPNIYANIIEVGEGAGQLEESFSQLAKYLYTEADTRKRIKSALRYPKIVVTALFAAVAVINVFVVPAFSSFFKSMGQDLPWATRVLVGSSDLFVNYWPLMLLAVIVVFVAIRLFLRSPGGRYIWDKKKLSLPIVGQLLTHIMLTRFAWSFSLMLRSGVPLLQGLTMVSKSAGNQYITDKVLAIRGDIESGKTLTQAIANSGLFTAMTMQMILVGEESGRTADMFEKIAVTYEKDTDFTIQRFSDMLEPTLLVCMAGMVLVLALGIFMPMYGMMGAASGR